MISVIMPSMNRATHIRGAVEAVLAQTYTDWELIIKEGGIGEGYDAIKDLLTDKRITYIYSHDTGISNAFNIGLKLASGEIFNWANDDDRLLPNTFEKVIASIGDKEWLYGKIAFCRGEQKVGEMGHAGAFEQLKSGNFVPQPSVFWTRKALERIGYMNENLKYAQDYEYWLKLMQHFEPVFIDEILANYHFHPDQILAQHMDEQRLQARQVAQSI